MTTQQLRKEINVDDHFLFYNGLEVNYTLNGIDYTLMAGQAETLELFEDCDIISISRSGAIRVGDDPAELTWTELVEGLELTNRDIQDIIVMHESKKQYNGVIADFASIPDLIKEAI